MAQSFPSLAQDFRSSDNTADAHSHTPDLLWDYSRPVHAKVSHGYLQYWQDNDDTSQFPRESPRPGGPRSRVEMGHWKDLIMSKSIINYN